MDQACLEKVVSIHQKSIESRVLIDSIRFEPFKISWFDWMVGEFLRNWFRPIGFTEMKFKCHSLIENGWIFPSFFPPAFSLSLSLFPLFFLSVVVVAVVVVVVVVVVAVVAAAVSFVLAFDSQTGKPKINNNYTRRYQIIRSKINKREE